jgi:hypothetical protein
MLLIIDLSGRRSSLFPPPPSPLVKHFLSCCGTEVCPEVILKFGRGCGLLQLQVQVQAGVAVQVQVPSAVGLDYYYSGGVPIAT